MILLQQNASTLFGLTISDSLRVISILVAVISFVYGIIQNRRRKALERRVANDAIEIHDNVAKGLGAIQAAKLQSTNGQDPSFEMGRTEGYLQALVTGTAKTFCNIRKTSIEDIDEMINSNQLMPNFRSAYIQFSHIERRGLFSNFIKWVKKLY